MSPRSETPDPWRQAMEDAGMYSLNDLGRRTGIATSTVSALVYGRRKSDERTIQAVAKALRLPEPTIRGWAAVALGEVGPWEPPAEAARLSKRQRAALNELIRAMTADTGLVQSASGSGKTQSLVAVAEAASADAVVVVEDRERLDSDEPVQDDYTLAARRGLSEGQRQRAEQDQDAES